MKLQRQLVIALLKGVTHLLCRIDAAQLQRVPTKGPLLMVVNHVNILEIPILFTQLQPRPVTGLVLARRWDNPWLRWLLQVCGAIPLRRGEADVAALRCGLEMLESGHILLIAPEGTRSGHGRLQTAKPGAVLLALRSQAAILPVAYYGAENYRANIKRLRRTEFHIVVGRPFYLDARGDKTTGRVRQQMIDEIMYQMAALLPPDYRGDYANLESATNTYLRFVETADA